MPPAVEDATPNPAEEQDRQRCEKEASKGHESDFENVLLTWQPLLHRSYLQGKDPQPGGLQDQCRLYGMSIAAAWFNRSERRWRP